MKINRNTFILYIFLLVILSSCSYSKQRIKNYAFNIYREFYPIKSENYIIPYSLNLISIYKVQKGEDIKNIKKYINWYFDHLNYPDKFGITGSIYDYIITKDGEEKSTENFDSIDSYSGTFLVLLNNYLTRTGDKKLFYENKKKIKDIAYTIVFLQKEDGLTTPTPAMQIKYLMNNCEAYWGIKSFIEIAEKMGWNIEKAYIISEKNFEHSIMKKFYCKEKRNFYWAISENKKFRSNWENFYPDAYAQIFPIVCGIIKEKKLAINIWENFYKRYKGKTDLEVEQKTMIDFARRKL